MPRPLAAGGPTARARANPVMFKRDIKRAFRTLAIRREHLHLFAMLWCFEGCVYRADHVAMPFGTVGAVYGWHRFANVYLAALRRLFLVPAAKFVDDFFGAGRSGVKWTAGR